VDTFVVAEQRRRCYRVKVDWPGTVQTSRGPVEALILDISPGGAHLRCEQPLQSGESVELTIQPPEREPLRITGTVAWSKPFAESTPPHVLGLCFIAIQPEDRRFLELFTAQQLRARISASGDEPLKPGRVIKEG
jgi:c-di-GMP-binding flagellar brake protein YcgR